MSLDELVEWTAERVLRARQESGEEDAEAEAAAKKQKMMAVAEMVTHAKGGKDLRDGHGNTHR